MFSICPGLCAEEVILLFLLVGFAIWCVFKVMDHNPSNYLSWWVAAIFLGFLFIMWLTGGGDPNRGFYGC